MDKFEFLDEILRLELFYPSFNLSSNKTALNEWYKVLGQYDVLTFRKAIAKHISSIQIYSPNIATLYQCVKDVRLQEFKSPETLFDMLTENIINNDTGISKQSTIRDLGIDEDTKTYFYDVINSIDSRFPATIKDNDKYRMNKLKNDFIKKYNEKIHSIVDENIETRLLELSSDNMTQKKELSQGQLNK